MNPRSIVHHALRYLGAPYVWRGKGLDLWSPVAPLSHHWGEEVFDCSGLVTTALKDAGGPDWRFTHSAQALFDELKPVDAGAFGSLKFYGANAKAVTHVAFDLGNGLVLEAAGGDSTTVTPSIAKQRGAKVRVALDYRRDGVGSRALV